MALVIPISDNQVAWMVARLLARKLADLIGGDAEALLRNAVELVKERMEEP